MKIWLVYKDSGAYSDYQRVVHEVCATPGRAQISVMHIKADIQNIKNKYFKKYGNHYDDDLAYRNHTASINMDSELYDTIDDRIWDFELANPILDIHDIHIEERELKY